MNTIRKNLLVLCFILLGFTSLYAQTGLATPPNDSNKVYTRFIDGTIVNKNFNKTYKIRILGLQTLTETDIIGEKETEFAHQNMTSFNDSLCKEFRKELDKITDNVFEYQKRYEINVEITLNTIQ
jgi:hypothetical protein